MSPLSSYLNIIFFSLLSASLIESVKGDRGLDTFTTQGFPAIACIGGSLIFIYTLYFSAAKTGYGGWRNHALWFISDIFLYMFGIFLIFGPDTLGNIAGNGGSIERAAIIGLQLTFQASMGIFAIYSSNAYASLVFGIFGVFNILCLMGSNLLFNYNEPIWVLNSGECNAYFATDTTNTNFTRCSDTGYLEFLRIIGSLAIILEGYLIVVSMLAYATAVPYTGVPAAGVPAGAAGSYPGGYSTVPPTTTMAPAGTTGYTTTGQPVMA